MAVATRPRPADLIAIEAERRRRAREAGLPTVRRPGEGSHAERYGKDCARFIREVLGWQPWAGEGDDKPGQLEVIRAYELALAQQHERLDFERGRLSEDELKVWKPGQVIQNWIRVEAGHSVGKTKLASGVAHHFFACHDGVQGRTFAPTYDQLRDLFWKEFRVDHQAGRLPGRVLETCRIQLAPDYFLQGVAYSPHKGSEGIQGLHGRYLLFILDEAEKIDPAVFEAVKSQATGGIVIVLLLGNPRTQTSRFHTIRGLPHVRNFRIASPDHPNVVLGRTVVEGAITREAVQGYIGELCEIVQEHNADEHTFTLDWDAWVPDPGDPDAPPKLCPAGTIFKPDPEFLWRMLGLAPAESGDKTFVPVGRYEAAVARGRGQRSAPLPASHPEGGSKASVGVDVARDGDDKGTVYVRQAARVWRAARLVHQDTNEYARRIRVVCLELIRAGVKHISVRIDGGGGYGGGVRDRVVTDGELRDAQRAAHCIIAVKLVLNNRAPKDGKKYDDLGTEIYAHTGEALKQLALINPPEALRVDLTGRRYDWTTRGAHEVKTLEQKKDFKKRLQGVSPDDGDGCALACAPEFLFIRPRGTAPDASPVYHTP